MDLLEFQAKALLEERGIATPGGRVAESVDHAGQIANELGSERFAVKAQIRAGRRGPAGGVKLVDSPNQVQTVTKEMLGSRLVTQQTGAAGLVVDRVFVERAVSIDRELYAAVLVNRSTGKVNALVSPEGGNPIYRLGAAAMKGMRELDLDGEVDMEGLARFMRLGEDRAAELVALLRTLAGAFRELDASLIEINPLALTAEGALVAVDVNMTIDDNALARHPDLTQLRDTDAGDPEEVEAHQYELNYVKLDGNIGIVATGAGIGLATLDMVIDAGGKPANFMDVRPVATRDQVAKGVSLLLSNPKVSALLVVAIGGGIQHCDSIAEGLGMSFRSKQRVVPTCFYAFGTGKELAALALRNQNIPVNFTEDLNEAVNRTVELANKGVA